MNANFRPAPDVAAYLGEAQTHAGSDVLRNADIWFSVPFAFDILMFGYQWGSDTVKASQFGRFVDRSIRFAGMLITAKRVRTKHGDLMEFLTFEDETGLVEATFFPPVYRRFCAILEQGRPYLLGGQIEEDFGAFTLTAAWIERINTQIADSA